MGALGLWLARLPPGADPGLQKQRRGPASPGLLAEGVTRIAPPGFLHDSGYCLCVSWRRLYLACGGWLETNHKVLCAHVLAMAVSEFKILC